MFELNKLDQSSNEYKLIVHFKRLGSRVFHVSFNQIYTSTIKSPSAVQMSISYSSFQNTVHIAKQMKYTLERILSDF